MQVSGGDDFSSSVLAHFTKNASYTDNYHEKYYYTELVHKRVVARRLRENERRAKSAHSKRDPDEKVQRSGSLPSAAAAATSATPSSGSQVGGSCSWYLVTGEQSRLSGDTAPSGLHQDTGSGELGADVRAGSIIVQGEASAREMADKDEQLSPAAAVGSWERVERSSGSGVNSSESVTSEDSVFSEDYTAMTDIAEPRNGSSGQPTNDDPSTRRRAPLELADDVDSSFSSPGSSTSTLEADGKEDGGGLEDKDKVVVSFGSSSSSSSPPLSHKTRPNIRLLLGQPIVDDDDDSPSPPTSGDRRPNEDDDGDVDMKKSESNSFYEDREFDFLKAEPVRRSTSLKTYKTPPGTPHRKKAVRFADALGLDLESVRHILNLEEPPEVPKSAMKDLVVGLEEENRTDGVKYLSALFSQPGVDPNFLRRVQEGKVVLENCIVDDKDMTISGTIRVANVAYHKLVVVRYTTNGWLSSEDVVASYVQNSNDGPTDRFSFTVNVPKYFAVGQRLEFALMYAAGGATYWDNNYGKNYVIECYARAMPISESDNTWMHFL